MMEVPSINIYGIFMHLEIKIITGLKLSSDPQVILLDIMINEIYTKE